MPSEHHGLPLPLDFNPSDPIDLNNGLNGSQTVQSAPATIQQFQQTALDITNPSQSATVGPDPDMPDISMLLPSSLVQLLGLNNGTSMGTSALGSNDSPSVNLSNQNHQHSPTTSPFGQDMQGTLYPPLCNDSVHNSNPLGPQTSFSYENPSVQYPYLVGVVPAPPHPNQFMTHQVTGHKYFVTHVNTEGDTIEHHFGMIRVEIVERNRNSGGSSIRRGSVTDLQSIYQNASESRLLFHLRSNPNSSLGFTRGSSPSMNDNQH